MNRWEGMSQHGKQRAVAFMHPAFGQLFGTFTISSAITTTTSPCVVGAWNFRAHHVTVAVGNDVRRRDRPTARSRESGSPVCLHEQMNREVNLSADPTDRCRDPAIDALVRIAETTRCRSSPAHRRDRRLARRSSRDGAAHSARRDAPIGRHRDRSKRRFQLAADRDLAHCFGFFNPVFPVPIPPV